MAAINFYTGGTLMSRELSETANSNVLRTEMEGGYQKQAKKFSKSLLTRNVVYLFTNAEYAAFKTWFYTTAANGSLFFNWTDVVDNVTKDARIVNGVYEARPVAPSLSHWYVSFQLETYV
jgi:hypothetical protein